MKSKNSRIYLDSEIGKLEEVIIHEPGREIEVITPVTAARLLYNDILPLGEVGKEYSILKAFLSTVAETVEVRDVLESVLAGDDARAEIIGSIAENSMLKNRENELYECSPSRLITILIEGLRNKINTLSSFLSENEFDYFPLPNLYFTRDSAMIFRDLIINGSMAHWVRKPEAVLMRQIFLRYYGMDNEKNIFDGTSVTDPGVTLEGGDFLVLNRQTILMGISERTTIDAVDILTDRLYEALKEPLLIYCVILPVKRETIHLDMIFTVVNTDEAVIYEPYITGEMQLKTVKISIDMKGEKNIRSVKNILSDLSGEQIILNPVLCGGNDKTLMQREQWLSGCNFFAFEPGKIIGYDCNEATLRALEGAGYKIRNSADFISGRDNTENYDKLAVTVPGTELARGGGGVRCMTLPVRRRRC